MFPRRILAVIWIHVVAKRERYQFYREVYRIETLLISPVKSFPNQDTLAIVFQDLFQPRSQGLSSSRPVDGKKRDPGNEVGFVSVWPAPEVVDGIFEVCPSATKFCPNCEQTGRTWFFIAMTDF